MASFLKYLELYLTSEWGRFYVGHSVYIYIYISNVSKKYTVSNFSPEDGSQKRLQLPTSLHSAYTQKIIINLIISEEPSYAPFNTSSHVALAWALTLQKCV
jgi:hypothetical protein